MKIVIAPDKFKGSLSSFAVCEAVAKGLLQASSSFQIIKLPMADGGDGLSEVIQQYTQASVQTAMVQDPLGRSISAEWLLSADGNTAFVEMAKASGLALLKKEEYNPLLTSTFGTGQLTKAAVESGVKNFVLGIGGSATTDGGTGMAAALGYRFLDEEENELSPIGKNLIRIQRIDGSKAMALKGIRFQTACDVKNPLYGPNGAAKIYAPQKGADETMVEELDKGLMNYAEVVKKDLGIDVSTTEGGGAAGGLGAGSVAFLKAQLIGGADLVMQYAKAEEHIASADVLITGEGKIDGQTLEGKLVAGIAALGKKHDKKVLAVCGVNEIQNGEPLGVSRIFSITDETKDLDDAMKNAADYLTRFGEQIGATLRSKHSK